jgi:hypothetical protein
LKFNKETPLAPVSDYEVLVKFHAASLNYRDLIIPKGQFSSIYLHYDKADETNDREIPICTKAGSCAWICELLLTHLYQRA